MKFLSILNSEIPAGGYGRTLTSAELSNLRKSGRPCSRGWIVLRYADSPTRGIVYRPARNGGYDNANILAEVKP